MRISDWSSDVCSSDLWRFVRRFLILEFDFESSAPLARIHGLFVARLILAPRDAPRAEALWSNLIEISLERAKAGGFVERVELRRLLSDRGFQFAGDRDFSVPRLKLAERSRQALRSEEPTSELHSLMRSSYAVYCLTKKTTHTTLIYILH